jgi:hypothetical protein
LEVRGGLANNAAIFYFIISWYSINWSIRIIIQMQEIAYIYIPALVGGGCVDQ